jgi:hypothetical protein
MKEKRKVGAPTKYKPDYARQAYKYALLGLTLEDMADLFDVSHQTIYDWKKAQPKFLEAIQEGGRKADATVAESLYKRAIGYSHQEDHISNYMGNITITPTIKHYPPDTKAANVWLGVRDPSRWKEKIEINGEIKNKVELSVDDAIIERYLKQIQENKKDDES